MSHQKTVPLGVASSLVEQRNPTKDIGMLNPTIYKPGAASLKSKPGKTKIGENKKNK
jgi:hypothetical protein